MKIAIVDDNAVDLNSLRMIITGYASESGIRIEIKSYTNAESLLAEYHAADFSMIFLDIYMNNMSGIDAAKRIRAYDPGIPIVFLTSSSDHMPDAFGVHAFQYILKTTQPDMIASKIHQVLDDYIMLGRTDRILSFTYRKTIYDLHYSDILYAESSNHNTHIYSSLGEEYSPRMTFAAVQENLMQDPRFLIINRGLIVNMDHITDFNNKVCVLQEHITLPISVRKYKSINQARQKYVFTKMHE